jgi:hypothetical protein
VLEAASILRRLFDGVDDEHLDRSFCALQLQPELVDRETMHRSDALVAADVEPAGPPTGGSD